MKAWIRNLAADLRTAKPTDAYTLSRDEVMELVGLQRPSAPANRTANNLRKYVFCGILEEIKKC